MKYCSANPIGGICESIKDGNEKDFLRYYTAHGYELINNCLRRREVPSINVELCIRALDNLFLEADDSPIEEPLYRGVQNLILDPCDEYSPDVSCERGYLSTTTSKDIANRFAMFGYILKIKVEGRIPHIKINGGENEILFPRNCVLHITDRFSRGINCTLTAPLKLQTYTDIFDKFSMISSESIPKEM